MRLAAVAQLALSLGQVEVIEPAVEDLAGDGDAKIGHFGEVRQSHPARRMLLAKDDLPIRAVHRPLSPDAPLERPLDPARRSALKKEGTRAASGQSELRSRRQSACASRSGNFMLHTGGGMDRL
jgi:hypothetical protein